MNIPTSKNAGDTPSLPRLVRPVRVYCSSCGKQVVKSWKPSRSDEDCTTAEGAKADFPPNVFCGYCAEDLDEYGLFPEERAQLGF